ncbi:MAG: alanine--glyoxylate aminotransferase family protein [Bdellovibrionales bacterium]|nr:alanine--glyoxylate aminotransferase family protein [Bdellovibrionales bacterium]
MTEKLLTPGPTPIPSQVIEAMNACANMHHRTPEFKEIFFETTKNYGSFAGSSEQVIFLSGTGTLGMEAAVRNICPAGKKIAFLNSGKFGERWGHIAKALSIDAIELSVEPRSMPCIDKVADTIKNDSSICAFCFQIVETSTGEFIDPSLIISAIKQSNPNCLIVADGITAIGALEIHQEELGIDVLICGSQKALMLPPGLTMLSFSNRAWDVISSVNCGSLYQNLSLEKKYQADGSSAWTPAIPLILGLKESLKIINEEGKENLFKRHIELSNICKQGILDLGLELYPKNPAVSVTAVYSENQNLEKIRQELLKKYQIRIAGGQDNLKGKIFRIGHMGFVFKEDIILALDAIRNIIKS